MRLLILSFGLIFLSLASAKNYLSDHDVARHMLKYAKKSQTDAEKEEFRKVVEILSFPKYIYRSPFSTYSKGRQTLSCMACRSAMNTMIRLHGEGATEAELIDLVTDICTLLEIQPMNVCRGVAELNAPIIIYIVENQPQFDTNTFCGVVMQSRRRDVCPYFDERFEWTIDLPDKKPNTPTKQPVVDKKVDSFKVVQLTDVHYDPIYEPNGLADCDEPACCRKGQTEKASRRWKSIYDDTSSEDRVQIENGVIYLDIDYAEEVQTRKENSRALDDKKSQENNQKQSKKAGYWGDYRHCDTPWWSFEDGVQQISQNHKDFEYIYYTGDTVDHGVWETSKDLITESINKTLSKFKTTFGNTPIFPVIGNHESQPLNQFAPSYVEDPKYSTAWLLNMLAEKWSVWLPSSTKQTIKKGGYYTAIVRPGLRLIVLNNNICYIYNWWVHLEPNDPNGQLAWLRDTLSEAENKGEKVHILAHIPAGLTDCYYTYTREYKRIIERFSETIVAEFNGHTHHDEFKIFYEKEGAHNPIGVAWNGGSFTTFADVNPNYRIYDIDSVTFDVMDYDMWVYNLTEANLHPTMRPRWYKEYSFKEHYGVKSMSPAEIDRLLHRMVRGDKRLLVEDYHNFRGKSSDPFVELGCDEECVFYNLCYMTTTELYDEERCESFWKIFNENRWNK